MKFNEEADKVTLTSKPPTPTQPKCNQKYNLVFMHYNMSSPFQPSVPPPNQTQGHRKYADCKQRQGVGRQAEKNTTVIKHIQEQYGSKKRVLSQTALFSGKITSLSVISSTWVHNPLSGHSYRMLWKTWDVGSGMEKRRYRDLFFTIWFWTYFNLSAKDANAVVKHVYLACVYIEKKWISSTTEWKNAFFVNLE